jgi:hypothetical protein
MNEIISLSIRIRHMLYIHHRTTALANETTNLITKGNIVQSDIDSQPTFLGSGPEQSDQLPSRQQR